MAAAGQIELVIELIRNARLDAQQHTVGKCGIRFGQIVVEQAFALGPQRVKQARKRMAQVGTIQGFNLGAVEQAMHALTRQEFSIRKIFEIWRCHQATVQSNWLAIQIALA